jgi:hypothetical protein
MTKKRRKTNFGQHIMSIEGTHIWLAEKIRTTSRRNKKISCGGKIEYRNHKYLREEQK